MSKSYAAASLHDSVNDAYHARHSAEILGQHIRSLRQSDDRGLEELAPQAGLTVTDWKAIEAGQLRVAWEQILLLARVLHLGRSWTPYLSRLWSKTGGDK